MQAEAVAAAAARPFALPRFGGGAAATAPPEQDPLQTAAIPHSTEMLPPADGQRVSSFDAGTISS